MIAYRRATTGTPCFGLPWLLVVFVLGSCGKDKSVATKVPPSSAETDSEALGQALAHLQNKELDVGIADFDNVIQLNPKNARAFYYRGVAWERKGELSKAIADYTAAIDLDARIVQARNSGDEAHVGQYTQAVALGADLAAEAHVKRGLIYNKQAAEAEVADQHRKYNDAIVDFTRAIELMPEQPKAYYGRGVALLGKGFPDIAIADFTRSLELRPHNTEALCQRARAQVALGESNRAIRDCQDAIGLDPKNAMAYSVLGSAYSACGEFAKSISYFDEAIRWDPNLAKTINPQSAEVWYRWGIALDKEGRRAEAEEAFGKARVLDPTIVEPKPVEKPGDASDRERAQPYYQRGLAHLDKGEFHEALDEFTEAIRSDENCAEAYYGRGLAFLKSDSPQTAIEDFTHAISLKRDYTEAYSQRCHAYTIMDDIHRALEDGTQAIRLRPKCAQAYANRGLAYLTRGDEDRAIADLTEAIRLAPELDTSLRTYIVQAREEQDRKKPPDRKAALTAYRRGVDHLKRREFHKAQRDFSEAIACDERFAEAYYGRGVAFLASNSPDTAIDDFKQAISLKPDYAQAYNERCRAYTMMHIYHRALADGTQAIRLRPDYAGAHVLRGFVYLAQGNYDRAIADLTNAVQLDPQLEPRLRPYLEKSRYKGGTRQPEVRLSG